MSLSVVLREVLSDLSEENKADSLRIDTPGTTSTVATLITGVCSAIGLAGRSSEFALWAVNDSDGPHLTFLFSFIL